MPRSTPSFARRVGLAFSVLFQPELAARLEQLRNPEASAPAATAAATVPSPAVAVAPANASAAAPVLRESSPEAALQLLGLLQREARFVDFVQEDVAAYSDADVGAAARVVHEGCRKVLREHFSIEPVRPEAEGSRVTLAEGFDAASIRLTGNVVGSPPFAGSLGHRGWRVTDSRLPKLAQGHDASVIAQAEVEL
ncbi:MAG: DUF2760 domain-containing protein [Proteobacteria bacterium]|nr:DUF2760 domain-containing protein [Pseudomonadota bacterium]MBS0555294.1 DUF2760 domain-containing protein [Pseudomonadota bacterium]